MAREPPEAAHEDALSARLDRFGGEETNHLFIGLGLEIEFLQVGAPGEKAFKLSLGEALSHKLRGRGVDVVVACAGTTRTPGFLEAMAGRRGPRAMSPEAVAREALAALDRPGACVPGIQNRLAQAIMTRLLPRRLAVRIMGRETEKLL